MFVPPPPPPLLTPHFYFPLELYVYITLTNNYLAFFIYQLIILWTISINWHRWLLLNNHIFKYNSFKIVLYRRYINYVSVSPPPPTLPRHTHFLAPSYATNVAKNNWPELLYWGNLITEKGKRIFNRTITGTFNLFTEYFVLITHVHNGRYAYIYIYISLA